MTRVKPCASSFFCGRGAMITIEQILLAAAVLLLLSIVSSKASHSLGIPALILFLVIGMLAGSEGFGGIYFDNAWGAKALGVVALAFILFSGGLDTDWQRTRPVLGSGLMLANVGVLVSAGLVALFAIAALDFTPLEGLLLGAVVSSTDAAAVFNVLRARDVNLRGNLEPLIELESGSNDPIAVFLTLALIELISVPDTSVLALVPLFVLEMGLGALCGYAMGRVMTWLINHIRLRQEGLYPVLTIALVMFTYGATVLLHGNGFLAVYIAGIVLGNRDFVHHRSLVRFHDGLSWLVQIAMFLALGLLVYPSRLVPVAGGGLLLALFLMFVARPVSVFVALLFSGLRSADKGMVAWAGLRGAVPIVMATFPLLAGVPKSDTIFNLVYFAVLASVLVQGTSIAAVARWLRVQQLRPVQHHFPQEYVPKISTNSLLTELAIPASSLVVGRAIVELRLPKGALVVLIRRAEDEFVPNGGTVIEAGDTLLLLADPQALKDTQMLLNLS